MNSQPEQESKVDPVGEMIRTSLNNAYSEERKWDGDINQNGESPELLALLNHARVDIKKYSIEALMRTLRGNPVRLVSFEFDPQKPDVIEITCGSPRPNVVPWKRNLTTQMLIEAGVISSPNELLPLVKKPE